MGPEHYSAVDRTTTVKLEKSEKCPAPANRQPAKK
jgi:hypothetical protein